MVASANLQRSDTFLVTEDDVSEFVERMCLSTRFFCVHTILCAIDAHFAVRIIYTYPLVFCVFSRVFVRVWLTKYIYCMHTCTHVNVHICTLNFLSRASHALLLNKSCHSIHIHTGIQAHACILMDLSLAGLYAHLHKLHIFFCLGCRSIRHTHPYTGPHTNTRRFRYLHALTKFVHMA